MAREDIRRETLCEMLNQELRKSTEPTDCEITQVTWQERDENDTNWHYRATFGGANPDLFRERVDTLIAAAKEKYNITEKR
jgi:hypothetical protein|tara:strand:- start:1160 stop:1402 length:243 start_codon:yes stop_codon:yes gene_type:complete